MQRLPQTLAQLSNQFDLVHGFNISWEHSLLAGWQWAKKQQLPLAVTPFAHLGEGSHDRVALNSTMDHQRRVLREADVVFTLTAIEQQGLVARGIQMQRVTAVGSGLDPLPPTADFNLLQQKHRLTHPFIIFIGRNSFEKGAIHAVQAVLALRQAGSAVTLVLVGQMAEEFKRFYGRLTEAEKVGIRPLGIVTEQEKHTLLHNADMLLLPSRTDSFGIVLLEAWAHGKPVIGAKAGGIPGVIDDDQNGILVSFGDVPALAQAIRHLLTNPDLAHKLGANGRTKVTTHYTWSHVTDQVEAQYRLLITDH